MPDIVDPPVYTALLRVKPDDMTLGGWATRAGLARNVFNLIRKHGNPKHDTLQKLLDVAGVSYAEFDAGLAPSAERGERAGANVHDPYWVFRGHNRPRDIPVLGTPSCGDYEVDGQHIETVEMDLDEVIDYVRRPATLDGRKDVYAIYPQGFSMAPKFQPPDVAYVDTRKPPAIGDYVVVQLKPREGADVGDRIVSALLKRLVRQTAEYVELEQFNPAATFKVERRRIAAMHRIFPLAELVGI